MLIGFRGLLTSHPDSKDPVDHSLFNKFADRHLIRVLSLLKPVTKRQTDEAMDYIKGFWYGLGLNGLGLRRRNFDAFNPVTPWLVTEIEIPGKLAEGTALRSPTSLGRLPAASIEIPTQHDGVPLESLAYLEIASVRPEIATIMPGLTAQGVIKSYSDFRPLVEAIRESEKKEPSNSEVDLPGPPVP